MSNHINHEWSEDRRRFDSGTVLPLSISLAVSSSSLASSNYEGMRSEGRPSSSLSSSSSSNVSSRNKFSRPPLPPPPLHNMTPVGQLNNSEFETDPIVLARRQKQIDYGKNTQEYANYLKAVPIAQRGPDHPRTPPMHRKYSRRAWDGLIKQWRLNLHCWTYPEVSLANMDDGHLNFSSLLPPPSRSNLNDSFSSDMTSHSTSTTSSMAQALAIFSDYQIPSKPEDDGASRLLKLFASQKNGKNNNNNVPGRPSSSLCFAENRDREHELAQTYYSNRQAFSQTDLSSSGGLPREKSGGILWPTEKQEAGNGKGDLMELFKNRFN